MSDDVTYRSRIVRPSGGSSMEGRDSPLPPAGASPDAWEDHAGGVSDELVSLLRSFRTAVDRAVAVHHLHGPDVAALYHTSGQLTRYVSRFMAQRQREYHHATRQLELRWARTAPSDAVNALGPVVATALHGLLDACVGVTKCDRGLMYLPDDARGELVAVVAVGAGSVVPPARVPMGKGPISGVFRSGIAVNVRGTDRCPPELLPEALEEGRTGYSLSNTLVLPIFTEPEHLAPLSAVDRSSESNPARSVVGVLQLVNKRRALGSSFLEGDEVMAAHVSALASHVLHWSAAAGVQLVGPSAMVEGERLQQMMLTPTVFAARARFAHASLLEEGAEAVRSAQRRRDEAFERELQRQFALRGTVWRHASSYDRVGPFPVWRVGGAANGPDEASDASPGLAQRLASTRVVRDIRHLMAQYERGMMEASHACIGMRQELSACQSALAAEQRYARELEKLCATVGVAPPKRVGRSEDEMKNVVVELASRTGESTAARVARSQAIARCIDDTATGTLQDQVNDARANVIRARRYAYEGEKPPLDGNVVSDEDRAVLQELSTRHADEREALKSRQDEERACTLEGLRIKRLSLRPLQR